MADLNEKLNRFTARLLAEASEESRHALEEARQRRDDAFRQAEDQVLREAYQYIHREVARIKAEAGERVSRRMLENQQALALRREEMAQETFALVKARLAAFTRTPEYGRRLTELLAQALPRLEGAEDLEVFLRPADESWQPALRQAAGGRSLAFREGSFTLGGLVIQSAALGLRMDASFDSSAQALSGHFAELFGLSLADQNQTAEGGGAQ